MNNPWNIIKELEADNSRLEKEAIIRRESDADNDVFFEGVCMACLLYTSPSPRDLSTSRMPSSA